MKIVLAAILSMLTLVGGVHADTFQFDARTDFASLDEGTVPYYKDNPRAALAINAANEDYREVFARASTQFTETAGRYDVTITALGEIDGECEYRFLVNGVVVGTAVNQPTTTDYEVQEHTFTGINIPPGAEISVESNALTNGLVPEGDGTAYARGRWQTLTLETSEAAATPDSVDLALSVSSNAVVVNAGQTVEYLVTVENQHQQTTATSPVTGAALPAGLMFANSADCTSDGQTINCLLPELAPNQSTSVAFTATALQPGNAALVASVSANEPETTVTNNEVTHTIMVVENRSNSNNSGTGTAMSTGSGSFTPGMWLLLLLCASRRLRKSTPH